MPDHRELTVGLRNGLPAPAVWQAPARRVEDIRERKLETLEALRGVAALLVVMYHLQDVFAARSEIVSFGGVFGAGDHGVDLFFVISGFVITRTYTRDMGRPERVGRYLYKRFCRVVPSVWIMTGLAAAIYACHLGGLAKAGKLEPWNVAASLLLWPQTGPALVNVTWTLTYEMFFYGLFALLIASRRVGLVMLLIWQIATGLAAAGLLHPSDWLMAYYLRPICLEFGIGMLCALVVSQERLCAHVTRRGWIGLFLLGATVFVGSMVRENFAHRHMQEPERVLIYGLGPGLLVLALAMLERDAQLRVPAPLVWLGSMSYALYLTNYSMLTLAAIVLLRMGAIQLQTPVLLGCVVLAIAGGGAFHAWVDRPIQRGLQALWAACVRPATRRAPCFRLRRLSR